MSKLKNKVQLIGYLGKDVEVKVLDGGKVLAKVSIATTESFRNAKGERVFDTTWTNLVMWGKTAEFADKYLKKGQEIAIEGKLSNRSWEDKEGKRHYATEVIVSEIAMLGNKNDQKAA